MENHVEVEAGLLDRLAAALAAIEDVPVVPRHRWKVSQLLDSPAGRELLEWEEPRCGRGCSHGGACDLPRGHEPAPHETHDQRVGQHNDLLCSWPSVVEWRPMAAGAYRSDGDRIVSDVELGIASGYFVDPDSGERR